jgi:hypothetical protein
MLAREQKCNHFPQSLEALLSDQRETWRLENPTSEVPRGDPRYVAPECYENIIAIENDIFSFGLILYEIIVGKPVFPRSMEFGEIVGALVLRYYRPDIPDWVLPETGNLIRDCWTDNYLERPSFDEILD